MSEADARIKKDPVLRVSHLSKKFGKRQILSDVSFETYGGEVFGFLGPNGAGKTTTIKIIAGLLTLDEGDVAIAGYDLRDAFEKAMARVGGIVEDPEFYGYLTGYENLKLFANIRAGVSEERIREALCLVGLENRAGDKVGKYSLGMRQRLGLAQAMLHHPRLLVLDEPTNGLDPAGIKTLRDVICRFAREEGTSVLVSSHLMSEMELMCDRVGIIAKGRLMRVCAVSELTTTSGRVPFRFRVGDPARAVPVIRAAFPDASASAEGQLIDITVPAHTAGETVAAINATLVRNGIPVFSITEQGHRSLENVFIELTERGGEQIV